LLDAQEGPLGKAHKLNGVGCSMKRQPVQSEEMPTFIGIDYHKAYSVYSVLDAQGESLGQGCIDHAHPEDFRALVRRWSACRVVFEAGMNWHWLFELLEGATLRTHRAGQSL
jgi:hypothetical protein